MLQALSSLLTWFLAGGSVCQTIVCSCSLPLHFFGDFFFWLSANAINRSTVFSAAEGCFLPQPLGDGCKRQITGISSISFPCLTALDSPSSASLLYTFFRENTPSKTCWALRVENLSCFKESFPAPVSSDNPSQTSAACRGWGRGNPVCRVGSYQGRYDLWKRNSAPKRGYGQVCAIWRKTGRWNKTRHMCCWGCWILESSLHGILRHSTKPRYIKSLCCFTSLKDAVNGQIFLGLLKLLQPREAPPEVKGWIQHTWDLILSSQHYLPLAVVPLSRSQSTL